MSGRSFTAIIVAAGQGRRLGELGKQYSKPMVPILERPLIYWGVTALRAVGAKRVIVVAHPDNEPLRRYSVDDLGAELALQPQRLGIADAVLRGMSLLSAGEPSLACACDSLFLSVELAELVDLGRAEPAVARIGVLDMGRDATISRSAVTVSDGRVVSIVEKPARSESPLVGLPLYWLPAAVEPYLRQAAPLNGEQHVTTGLAAWIEAGGVVKAERLSERLELTSAADVASFEANLARFVIP